MTERKSLAVRTGSLLVAVCCGFLPLCSAAADPEAARKADVRVLLAIDSANLDSYLHGHLRYPRDIPPDFLKDFERLVEGFEKHLTAMAAPRDAESLIEQLASPSQKTRDEAAE